MKAILLLSGGLDSILAGRLLLQQGIDVLALNFSTPFCNCTPKNSSCSAAKQAADEMGISVKVVACGEDYLEKMKHPRFGRGSGMNACLDCRIHLFGKAGEYMKESGAAFIATGEVLGERPMSQRRDAMRIIEKESGMEGLIVRPLSAQHFPPSIPEQNHWINREQLLAFQGRGRKPQIQLAETLGVLNYPCPAGGCLLTDKEFAARFRELLERQPNFKLADARLLKFGRHFRLASGAKVIVGRDEKENQILDRLRGQDDVLITPDNIMGPVVLVRGPVSTASIEQAAAFLPAYAGQVGSEPVVVNIIRHGLADANLTLTRTVDRRSLAAMKIGLAQAQGTAAPVLPAR